MASTPLSGPSGPAPAKKSRKPLLLLLALGVIAVIGGAIYKSKTQQKSIVVTTEKASIRTITQLVSATGKIQPETEVKISPEVAGEIVLLPLREGAAVKKGDLLIRIKPDFYQAQVEQREADLAAGKAGAIQTKAQLDKAHEDLQRAEDLFAKKLLPESDFSGVRTAADVAQANYESALASIRRAEGQLKQARDQLDKTVVYSPIDGSISSLTSERGERVVGTGQFAGTEVMRVADLSNMEVRVNVNESDVVNVKVGDRARIQIDAFPGRKFAGTVKEIASSAKTTGAMTQEEVTNFLVKIRISDREASMRPGMSANADIETRTVENVVAVPIQSVTVRSREGNKTIEQLADERDRKAKEGQGDGAASAVNERQQRERERKDRDSLQRVVFVRQADDTVRQVPVETGINDTTHLQILSGVKEGDEVVSGSFSVIARILKDKSRIRIETPKKPEDK